MKPICLVTKILLATLWLLPGYPLAAKAKAADLEFINYADKAVYASAWEMPLVG